MLRLARKIMQKVPLLRNTPLLWSDGNTPRPVPDKYEAETSFWRLEIGQYVAWYKGEVTLYGTAPPNSDQKITGYDERLNAIETWLNLHQLPKYPRNLGLSCDALTGLRVLDIGCGPFPGLRAFTGCAVRVGIDPLIEAYQHIGFPLDRWSDNYLYCRANAENLPFPSHSFDAVVSCNAIDHVDDFAEVAHEVRRVLKTGGKFCMEVHYHKRTVTEPIELSDAVFKLHYDWVHGLRKSKDGLATNSGGTVASLGEKYVVWTNIDRELCG